MENFKKCVIYARYSCSNQTEQSIEGQLFDCEKYAERSGLQIVHTYIDRAMTATSDKRPQFQQMIQDSEKGLFDTVLVWKLDRFARNRYDSAVYKNRLKANNVHVISVMENITDTPEGVLMESVLEGFAEYFSKDLAQKTLRGMKETAKKHKVTGRLPFGYIKADDNTCIPDEKTAPAVRKMFEMYIDGEKKSDIADYLNNHGYRTSYGNKFTANAITPLIRNPRYTGSYKYADVEIHDENQRIISDEVFNQAQQEIICNNHCNGSMRLAKERYLLSKIFYCGHCGNKMHAECGRSGKGIVHRYYSCSGRKRLHICNSKNIQKEKIEDYVFKKLSDLLKRDDIIKRIANAIVSLQKQNTRQSDVMSALENNLADTKRKITNLMNAIEEGIITQTTQHRLKELEKIKTNLEYEIANAKLKINRYSEADILRFLKSFDLNNLNTWQEKQRIITQFINRIYLWDNKLLIIYNFTGKPYDEYDYKNIDKIISDIAENRSTISQSGSPSPARTDDPAVNSRMLCQTLRLTIIWAGELYFKFFCQIFRLS